MVCGIVVMLGTFVDGVDGHQKITTTLHLLHIKGINKRLVSPLIENSTAILGYVKIHYLI